MMFNMHDVMLFMTAGLSVLLAVPMLLQSQRRLRDTTLALFILTQGSAALYYVLLFSGAFRLQTLAALAPFQIFPLITLYWLQGLLLYWYAQAMGGHSTRPMKWDIIVAVFLFTEPLLRFLIVWATGNWDDSVGGIQMALPALTASVIYGFRALRFLRRHDQKIRERHSNIDNINLIWLRYVAYGFVGIWCCRLVGVMTVSRFWSEFLSTVANVPEIILIAWMVILGLRHAGYRSRPNEREAKSDLSTDDKRYNPDMLNKLEDIMVRVKVYQDPDLSLEGLADSLGTSPRSLSSLINGHHKQNFYDFVNNYRILEAKSRLQDPENQQLNIQRIFEDAGFRSKSTFNTLFKKVTGKTPTEFRRSSIAMSPIRLDMGGSSGTR